MQPLQGPADAQPGLIRMGHRLLNQPLTDRCHRRAQACRGLQHPGAERGGRERDSGQRLEQLGAALIGQLLILGEIHRQRRDPWPVLHRRSDAAGEGTAMPLAAGAHAHHGAILGDRAANHQIGDLATFGQLLNGDVRQVTPAGAATSERNNDGVLGIFAQCLGGPSARRLLAARLTQRARRVFLNGGFYGGGLLELGLALARRAAHFRTRSDRRSPCARRPASSVPKRATSASRLSAGTLAAAYSDLARTYAPPPLSRLGFRSAATNV